MQIYIGHNSKYMKIHLMLNEARAVNSFQEYIKEVGAMQELRSDNARVMISQPWQDIERKYLIKRTFSEPYHQWSNLAERYVQVAKAQALLMMKRSKAPMNEIGNAILHAQDIWNHVPNASTKGRTPHELCFGETADISALMFEFYERILYLDPVAPFPQPKEKKGRFLGVARDSGDELTFRVRSAEGGVLVRSIVWSQTREDAEYGEAESRGDDGISNLRDRQVGSAQSVGVTTGGTSYTEENSMDEEGGVAITEAPAKPLPEVIEVSDTEEDRDLGVGPNEDDVRDDHGIGSNEERVRDDHGIGPNEERVRDDHGIGPNEERVRDDQGIGPNEEGVKNEEGVSDDHGIGPNEERVRDDHGIGSNEEGVKDQEVDPNNEDDHGVDHNKEEDDGWREIAALVEDVLGYEDREPEKRENPVGIEEPERGKADPQEYPMEQLVEMEEPQEETEAEIIHRQETEGVDTYAIKEPELGKHYSQCLVGDDVVDIVGNRHAYRKDEVLRRRLLQV